MLKSIVIVALSLGVPAFAAAQGESGAPPMGAPTPFEEFVNKLKLDRKTQQPKVEQLFTLTATDAVPVGQELTQLRQRLVNIHLSAKPEDAPAVVAAYAAAAAKMAALEAKTFAAVYELLDAKQQPRAAEAFALMAGLFHPSAPRGGRGGPRGGGGGGGGIRMDATVAAVPQRGGGGGGGGDLSFTTARTRFDILDTAFTFEKEQEKPVKLLFDEAQKAAAPARLALRTTRDALAAAITSHAPAEALDGAVRAYAAPVAAMTDLEMKTLAALLKSLSPAQRANATAVQTAFFMMRGTFLDEKKWDKVPEGKSY